ncbi:MAG: SIS domain-containing protein [Actinobacteria bacterium]|nr:SIS domain-containing protein [Actinomycetota bacterium]
MLATNYLSEIQKILTRVSTTQSGAIESAADLIADSLSRGGVVHLFGAGHSHMLCEEAFYRAGGLAAINPILDPGLMPHEGAVRSSLLERLEGYGQILIAQQDLRPGEVIVVISTSGRNAVPVEVALEAKKRGLTVVAITSAEYSRFTTSRHSSGKLLLDVADVVIDNCGVPGDAILEHPGVPVKFAPTSTAVGAAIINAIMAEAGEKLAVRGIEPPVFLSGNLDGADARNLELVGRYKNRVRLL